MTIEVKVGGTGDITFCSADAMSISCIVVIIYILLYICSYCGGSISSDDQQ